MADRLVRWLRSDRNEVDFLPINPKPPGILAFAEKVKFLRTAIVSGLYCLSLIRRVRHYDVIHLFSASYLSFLISQMPALLVSRMYGKPVILNYRSGEARDHLDKASRLVFALLRMCERIVVPSRFLVEVFAEFGFDASAIANVVDPDELRPRLRSRAVPRLIVPRTLDPLYDVACAIRAYAIVKRQYPDALLTLLGEGSEESALRALVHEMGLRDVVFAGRVARGDIGAYYDRHDVLLNTSAIDNMPVSILEGFAAGLPIVTTDAGGIPFIVRDGENGAVEKVGDHAALARRILQLADDPAEVERLSRASLDEAQRYVWKEVGAAWRRLYGEVAAGRPAKRAKEARS